MKKMLKAVLSLILVVSFFINLTTLTEAVEPITRDEYSEKSYYLADGTLVEEISFVENGEEAKVVKKTQIDGSFNVTAINGNRSKSFKGEVKNAPAVPLSMYPIAFDSVTNDATFPRYTPYWYVGYSDYTQNGTALTIAVLTAAVVAMTGVGVSWAYSAGVQIYQSLGGQFDGKNLYFRNHRYYATLEQGPGLLMIWYTKFKIYTYRDAARTKLIAGPVEKIYETDHPM